MEIVKDVLLILHFLGLAAIIGGVLVQARAREKRLEAAVLHGGLTQLVTGLALMGINEAIDQDMDYIKMGVKLLVVLVIVGLALRYRGERSVSSAVWGTVGALAVLNVVIAVVW